MGVVNSLLWKFVELFPRKVDVIHTENEPYLLRFHFKHCGKLPGIYLHYFYKSDTDRHLHNHPWRRSTSLILSGGYRETRMRPEVSTKSQTIQFLLPGRINKIDEKDFHKVELLSNKTWTLFISRDRIQNWGFWVDGKFIPHWEYNPDENTANGTYVTDLLGNPKNLTEN